jgi:UDP-2,3-diacylglucosamine pyrophosphatase LpxH
VIISEIATLFYKFFQRFDTENQRISRWMKQRSKIWLRVSGKVAREAIEYARKKGVQHVFCGHTHQAMKLSDGDITYYNSGCWTDKPSQFISIDLASAITINDYM